MFQMYYLRSEHCPDIELSEGKAVVLGRGPLTAIKGRHIGAFFKVGFLSSGRSPVIQLIIHLYRIVNLLQLMIAYAKMSTRPDSEICPHKKNE